MEKRLRPKFNTFWNRGKILRFAHKFAIPDTLRGSPTWKRFAMRSQPTWNRLAIVKAHLYTIAPFRKNLVFFSELSPSYLRDCACTANLLKLPTFGNLSSPHHMFQFSDTQWGFVLHEQQITKGLTYFLQQSSVASWCFIAALMDSNSTKLDKKLKLDKQRFLQSICVEAEHSAGKKRRIDIYLSWRSVNDKRCCIVLECKLESPISAGQLKSYAHFARKHSDDDQYRLFVIARQRDRKSDEELKKRSNREWHYLEWKDLLQRWERYLAQENIPEITDFPRFRRTLWKRTVEH